MRIRDATPADLPAIDEIYSPYVLESDCTLELTPMSLDERQAWFLRHDGLPILICEEPDGAVSGYAYLTPFQPRPGYRFTLEDSVYVRRGFERRGIGATLLAELLRRAEASPDVHTLVAKISATQEVSIALHEKHGFTEVGRLLEVGFKLGRWTDVVLMQRAV